MELLSEASISDRDDQEDIVNMLVEFIQKQIKSLQDFLGNSSHEHDDVTDKRLLELHNHVTEIERYLPILTKMRLKNMPLLVEAKDGDSERIHKFTKQSVLQRYAHYKQVLRALELYMTTIECASPSTILNKAKHYRSDDEEDDDDSTDDGTGELGEDGDSEYSQTSQGRTPRSSDSSDDVDDDFHGSNSESQDTSARYTKYTPRKRTKYNR